MQTGNFFAFSDILIQGLKDEGLNMTQLSDILTEKGHSITRRRLSEYYNQVSTPPFEKAREIVKALNIEIPGISRNFIEEEFRYNPIEISRYPRIISNINIIGKIKIYIFYYHLLQNDIQ